jgi:hypothetical protein
MRRPVDVKAHFRFVLSPESIPIQLSRPSRHPSIHTLCERYSLGARWAFSFGRCCCLVIDLSSYIFGLESVPGVDRSHLDSAGELSCLDRNSLAARPPRASLFGVAQWFVHLSAYPHAGISTTDAAAPPTFEPRQPPLVFWHFSLLAPQASVPICADHCLHQTALECNALPEPSSFADTGLLLC